MGPNLMTPAPKPGRVAPHRGRAARRPANRELLINLPTGDTRKLRRPDGPPSEWPDWRELTRQPAA